jgi:hypothetical protein
MRQFEARIGINANVDNLVVDVNGRKNLAGAGINLAQRVMSTADGNQIMVGQPVFETLVQREKYLGAFRPYPARIKHGIILPVYQFVEEGHEGLSLEVPSQFQAATAPKLRLTRFVAYYFANAMLHRNFLKKNIKNGSEPYVSTLLLYFLAMDSVGRAESSDVRPYRPITWGDGKRPIDEQFQYYSRTDFWVLAEASRFVVAAELERYHRYFEPSTVLTWQFISQEGQDKLLEEWPEIWSEFALEKQVTR